MNLNQTITELRAERDQLDRVIAQLESLAAFGNGEQPARSTRGRKSMGEAERHEVSERMKRYWAKRRKARGATA